jgi:hypothetical protein
LGFFWIIRGLNIIEKGINDMAGVGGVDAAAARLQTLVRAQQESRQVNQIKAAARLQTLVRAQQESRQVEQRRRIGGGALSKDQSIAIIFKVMGMVPPSEKAMTHNVEAMILKEAIHHPQHWRAFLIAGGGELSEKIHLPQLSVRDYVKGVSLRRAFRGSPMFWFLGIDMRVKDFVQQKIHPPKGEVFVDMVIKGLSQCLEGKSLSPQQCLETIYSLVMQGAMFSPSSVKCIFDMMKMFCKDSVCFNQFGTQLYKICSYVLEYKNQLPSNDPLKSQIDDYFLSEGLDIYKRLATLLNGALCASASCYHELSWRGHQAVMDKGCVKVCALPLLPSHLNDLFLQQLYPLVRQVFP